MSRRPKSSSSSSSAHVCTVSEAVSNCHAISRIAYVWCTWRMETGLYTVEYEPHIKFSREHIPIERSYRRFEDALRGAIEMSAAYHQYIEKEECIYGKEARRRRNWYWKRRQQ